MQQIVFASDVKNKKSLTPILYSIASCPKPLYNQSELVNPNYSFNMPFKISLKKPLEAFFSIPNGVQLKTLLPTILEVFLKHLSYCRRQVFHDDGFDKVNNSLTLTVILPLASTGS